MAERPHMRDTGFVMAFPRTPHLLVGAIAGLGSALWLNVVGPLAASIAAWGALVLVNVLAVALIAVLTALIAAAGGLVAADWRADAASRRAWAQIDSGAAEFSPPVDVGTSWIIDPRHLPAADSEALRRVFRAHRFASPEPLQAIPELPAAICATRILAASVGPIPARTTRDVAPKITCDHGIEVRISDRASQTFASIVSAKAPGIVASCRGVPQMLRGERIASRTRLVVNASPWSWWPTRHQSILPCAPPGGHVADIVVLASDRDDQRQRDLLPDRSTRGSIASNAELPNCRGPPSVGDQRWPATEAPSGKRSVECENRAGADGGLPLRDPDVLDNLGHRVPVRAAELDVIEMYLDQALRDLLTSAKAAPEQEDA